MTRTRAEKKSAMTKLWPDAHTALEGIVRDGMLLAIGGFGLCGIPEALIAARVPGDSTLAAIVVGLSGYEGDWHGREPAFGGVTVRYKHDTVIALAGAIRERPAAVVIAGTGSVAYGESGVREPVRAGGFGYLFGDEGSSFAIARTALAGAMRMTDRGVLTDLGSAALAFFDCPDLRALARAVSSASRCMS